MKELVLAAQFKRDLKLCQRRGYDIARLSAVLVTLQSDMALPPQNRDHPLVGNWIPKRECHIGPNWLLIYETTPTEVRLARTGTHADLFGK
ncbi:MAG: type II toxin-antitoxin system YafQ family toxin [Kiritimatiellae bacterium]|nr:type II toxin-antitoxin system YafQ family toxin [Kiritimatiellia bacterium]